MDEGGEVAREALAVGVVQPPEPHAYFVLGVAVAGHLAKPYDLAGRMERRRVKRQFQRQRKLLAHLKRHRRRKPHPGFADVLRETPLGLHRARVGKLHEHRAADSNMPTSFLHGYLRWWRGLGVIYSLVLLPPTPAGSTPSPYRESTSPQTAAGSPPPPPTPPPPPGGRAARRVDEILGLQMLFRDHAAHRLLDHRRVKAGE